jgi:hypothetical protein
MRGCDECCDGRGDIKGSLLADIIDAEFYLGHTDAMKFFGLPVSRMSRDELLAVIGYMWSFWPTGPYKWKDDAE